MTPLVNTPAITAKAASPATSSRGAVRTDPSPGGASRVKLLIFEPYPMGEGSGNLRTLWYILKLLDRSRFDPIVVSPQESGFLSRFANWGIEVLVQTPPATVHRFGGKVLADRFLARVRSAVDVFRYNLRLARFMRERGIAVVYCNGIRAVLLVGIGARLAGARVMWYVKGALENPLLDRIGFFIANRIIYFCEANREDKYRWLVRVLRRKTGIVRIGLDAAAIDQARDADKTALRTELDIRSDRFNAVVLGQVYPVKGQRFLLEGLRDIVREHPNFMLYVVGDHVIDEYRSYREELDRIIARESLEAHVRFTGWRTDALHVLAAMDMIIHPSLAEGFGRAVLEGMALGVPVVASAVGGLRELIRDGENGYLVPPGNTPALVDRVVRLAGDDSLRMEFAREGRREVLAHYRVEDKIRQLESIWSELAR
jgi:L-malate glycosyltransferase